MDSQIFQLPWHLTDNLEQVERNGREVGGRDAKQENYNSSTIRHCSVWHLQCPASTSCCQKEWSLHPQLYYWISFALWTRISGLQLQSKEQFISEDGPLSENAPFQAGAHLGHFLKWNSSRFYDGVKYFALPQKSFCGLIKVQRQSGVNTAQMIACWQRAL